MSSNTLALQYILVSSRLVDRNISTFQCILVRRSLLRHSLVSIMLTLQSILVSSGLVSCSLVGSNTLAALLLLSWPSMARSAPRRGRSGESRAWMAKADIEGHVDTTFRCGKVECGIATSRPNCHKLCQGGLDEVVVVHLEEEKLDHSESREIVIFTGKGDISEVRDGYQ